MKDKPPHNRYDWMKEKQPDGSQIIQQARQPAADRRTPPRVGFADDRLTELAAHQLPAMVRDVRGGGG